MKDTNQKYRNKKSNKFVEAVQWDGDSDTANVFIGEDFGEDWQYLDQSTSISIRCSGADYYEAADVGDYILKHRMTEGTQFSVMTQEDFERDFQLDTVKHTLHIQITGKPKTGKTSVAFALTSLLNMHGVEVKNLNEEDCIEQDFRRLSDATAIERIQSMASNCVSVEIATRPERANRDVSKDGPVQEVVSVSFSILEARVKRAIEAINRAIEATPHNGSSPSFKAGLDRAAEILVLNGLYSNAEPEGGRPVPKEEEREQLTISRDDLRALREYSCSLPTGTTIGKRWKKNSCAFDATRKGEAAEWSVGEYYELPEDDNTDAQGNKQTGIKWYTPIDSYGQPHRGDLSEEQPPPAPKQEALPDRLLADLGEGLAKSKNLPEIIDRLCASDISGADKEVLANCYKIAAFGAVVQKGIGDGDRGRAEIAQNALDRCMVVFVQDKKDGRA